MTPLELRTIEYLCTVTAAGDWLTPRTSSEGSVLQRLFRRGYATRRKRSEKGSVFEYQALGEHIAAARRLGVIPSQESSS